MHEDWSDYEGEYESEEDLDPLNMTVSLKGIVYEDEITTTQPQPDLQNIVVICSLNF